MDPAGGLKTTEIDQRRGQRPIAGRRGLHGRRATSGTVASHRRTGHTKRPAAGREDSD